MTRQLRIEYPGAIYHVTRLGWTAQDLAARSKGDVRKVRLAQRLRAETSVTWKWISAQWYLGAWAYAACLKLKIEPQNEFKLEYNTGD